MKIIFGKDDSIYKIFSILGKLPKNKRIYIYIEDGNEIFNDKWWFKQIIDFIKNNGLDVYFIVDKNKNYFLDYDKLIFKKTNFFEFLKYLIYDIYLFQKDLILRKTILGSILIFFELFLVISFFFIFLNFITHKAYIYIRPTYKIDTIGYRFILYSGDFKSSGRISIPYYETEKNIKIVKSVYIPSMVISNSVGKIILYNNTDKKLSFKGGTVFITEDGLLFVCNKPFYIDANSNIELTLTALTQDVNGNFIGERGNVLSGTKFYIYKYKPSYDLKLIYAVAKGNFYGGKSKAGGKVTSKDIQFLKSSLENTFNKNLNNYFDTEIPLIIKPFYESQILNYEFSHSEGMKTDILTGILIGKLKYKYIKRDDLREAFLKYLEQRKIENINLIDLDKSSIKFFEPYIVDQNIYFLTIQIDVLRSYNFNIDNKELIDNIKNYIAGKSIVEAKNYILKNYEIDYVDIKVNPPWYNSIPLLKENITFKLLK